MFLEKITSDGIAHLSYILGDGLKAAPDHTFKKMEENHLDGHCHVEKKNKRMRITIVLHATERLRNVSVVCNTTTDMFSGRLSSVHPVFRYGAWPCEPAKCCDQGQGFPMHCPYR